MQGTRYGSAVRSALVVRSPDDRLLSGTAAGVAHGLRVDVTVVRLGFLFLTLAGGVGVLLYGLAFVLSSDPDPEAAPAERAREVRSVAVGAIVVGVLLILREVGLWIGDAIVLPVAVAVTGSSLLGMRARDAKVVPAGPPRPLLRTARTVAGIGMVLLGTIWLVAATGSIRISVGSIVLVLAVVGGLSLVIGPFVLRAMRQAAAERRERIRSEERAAVAAHLHDSVLQTLALIQRSDASAEVARLARHQERELRSWLYGRRIGLSHGLLGEALEAMAARIEEHHAVSVDVVTVGDRLMDERLAALVEACGEAVLNAARHSGAVAVSVFVEVGADGIDAYIRDRGRGFDPGEVGHDRHGIADSIRARIRRADGRTVITSLPGEGTEVRLWIPGGPA